MAPPAPFEPPAALTNDVRASPVTGDPRVLLRLEGALLLAASVSVYAHLGASWITFGALFLLPDLSMLGYLTGPRVGALAYNAGHSLLTPGALAASALTLAQPTLLLVALIWFAHIGFDRALGYGLKYTTRFHDTHLGRVGARTPDR
ncbi:MAG: DUF4260 domain-containing protein [Myxococcales bacterium]|nr:DUF4260 domain-containing protein [Myxococcales bacterium]